MSPCLRNTEPRNYTGFGLPRAGFDVSSCNSPDTGVLSYSLRSFWLIPTFAASPVPVIVPNLTDSATVAITCSATRTGSPSAWHRLPI